MPPKKGKKTKKDDDDFWEKAGESVAQNNIHTPDAADDQDEGPSVKGEGGFSGFVALQMDTSHDPPDEEEEDFGGLMSTLKAAAKNKKDKGKKKRKQQGNSDEDELAPAVTETTQVETDTASKKPTEVIADDLADEEWGPAKEQKKKDKKGKKKGKAKDDDEEEEVAEQWQTPPSVVPEQSTATPKGVDDVDGEEEPTVKVLSKKEKEKLKKEREKAKKKAQAAAKKAAEQGDDEPQPSHAAPVSAPPTTELAKPEEDDGVEEGEGGDDAAKKKKKKKKGKKDEEPPAPAPAPAAAGKKKTTGISALKALMEAKKKQEEEQRLREEAERKRIEEEERREEEERLRKEEEKRRRKEKEKAKIELAKKQGTYLTKKQKEERAIAEMRKQALLASGVQIEGLQQQGNGASKRVVYGNKKKKGAAPKDSSPAPESRPETPDVAPSSVVVETPSAEPEAKDDWDAGSDEEAKAEVEAPAAPEPEPDAKDSWDASSDEEKDSKPAEPVSPTKKPAATPKATAKEMTTANTTNAKKTSASKPTQAKTVKDEETESEESSEESDSDSDDSEESSDEDSSEEEKTKAQVMDERRRADAAARRAKAHEEAMAARSKDNLRSPICCILGHVDTGKTKLLDKIRQTNVQEGEAGGITQQIGATYFPMEAIKQKTAVVNKDGQHEYKVPGLLIIDTPGHESFTNLRSRGSSLCNIAVLVVDIMHGLEAQTLESLRLLKDRKTPFIVALNKIDRLYGWEATPNGAVQDSLAKQNQAVQREFADRVSKAILAFAENGLNAVLYYENKNFARNVSIVPTSAITGEGVPDMIMLLVNLTQQRMTESLMYLSEISCTVLEVKVIEGLGTTIDVVLSNGVLREGEKIVVCGLNGPIVTQIRALLTPQPLRELRIKSAYVHHKEVKAALGVKLVAPDLEKAIAGSRLLVLGPDDDEDYLKEEVMSDLTDLLNRIDKTGRGVCVQASTLGSLEALLEFLRVSKIPVSGINIGPVHKRDIMRAATMLEKAKEYATILCFDVTVDKEADRLAEEMGIKLFRADIIYHLFDAFTAYQKEIDEAKRRDNAPQAVWPCRLKIIAAFAKRDPIILGVDIIDGTLRVGTPLAVVKTDAATGKKDIIELGKVTSLEINHKSLEVVKKSQAGGGVAVKIEHAVYQSAKMFGRHFDQSDEIYSQISRQSIDVLKNTFKSDVSNDEWLLIKALKPKFNIP